MTDTRRSNIKRTHAAHGDTAMHQYLFFLALYANKMMNLVDSMLRELDKLRMEVMELKERFSNLSGFFDLNDEEYNAIKRKLDEHRVRKKSRSGTYGFDVEICDDALRSIGSIDVSKIINVLRKPFSLPYERLRRCDLYRTRLGNYSIIYCVEGKTVFVLNVSCQDELRSGDR